MKATFIKYFAVLVLYFGITESTGAQTLINIADMALMSPGNTAVGVLIGESTEKVVEVLGQPNSISDYFLKWKIRTGKFTIMERTNFHSFETNSCILK